MSNQNAPILILQASEQPYLSLGCRFGKIKAFGHEYTYLSENDAFLRRDYQKKYNEHIKEKKDWYSFVEKISNI
jgi:hypothetical protein